MVDLQLNYPILPEQNVLFSKLLRETIAAHGSEMLELPPFGGPDHYRELAANWLGEMAKRYRKTVCCFAREGTTRSWFACLLFGLRGQRIAVDQLTYGNFKIQARALGMELLPCAGDEQGMKPSALRDVAERLRVAAVYLMPTVHNSLGTIMPETRRREICEVAGKHGLFILDDDAYRFLEEKPPPASRSCPRPSIFDLELYEAFCAAMKLALLSFPDGYEETLTAMIQVTCSGASLIFADIAARLIRSGSLTNLLARRRENAARPQTTGAHNS